MIEVLALPLAGMADRVRGGYPEGRRPKWVRDAAKAAAGAAMAVQVTTHPAIVTFVAVAVALLAWRQDNGFRGKWTRVAYGKWTYCKRDGSIHSIQVHELVLDAFRWGAIFALSMAPLAIVDWQSYLVMATACVLGTPIALYLAGLIKRVPMMEARTPWSVSELIGLPIIGGLYHLLRVAI